MIIPPRTRFPTGSTISAIIVPKGFSISSRSSKGCWAARATKELLPLQPGDVPESFADIEASRRDLGFEPQTTIEVGLARFVEWYKHYHKVN